MLSVYGIRRPTPVARPLYVADNGHDQHDAVFAVTSQSTVGIEVKHLEMARALH